MIYFSLQQGTYAFKENKSDGNELNGNLLSRHYYNNIQALL